MALTGKVALVTGASRGIGKGIALQLGQAGATVYITGRTLEDNDSSAPGSLRHTAIEIESRGGKAIPVACDHNKDAEVDKVFQQIEKEQGRLDILVNNAYSAVDALFNNFGKPFWEIPESIWDNINGVGLRNHYLCSVKAAKMMVKQKSGLIVTVSSAGGQTYLFTPAYGVGKVACDRMAADCALELKAHNIAYISLWPGAVKTEVVQANVRTDGTSVTKPVSTETLHLGANGYLMNAFAHGESPEFSGKCILALFSDPKLMEKTGTTLTTASISQEFGFEDSTN